MNTPWIRRIAIALLVLLLLVAGAVGLLFATFDAERSKAAAIQWVKSEYGRSLAIEGPLELALFPRLALRLNGVRLSEPGRPDLFLSIDEAALTVRLLPLLRKQLVVDRIGARGVQAAYLRDAEGRRNIDDLLTPAPKGDAGGGASAVPALRLDVSAIQLDDLKLRVQDQLAGVSGELALESFTSGRLAPGVSSPVALRARLRLTRPQAMALQLDGRMNLAFDPAAQTLVLGDLRLDLRGDAAGVAGLSTVLSAAQLTLDGKAERVAFEALKLEFKGRLGQRPLDLALDWPQLALEPKQLQGSAVSGRVELGGPDRLAGQFRSGSPSGGLDELRLPAVTLTLEGEAEGRKITLQAKSDLRLQLRRSRLEWVLDGRLNQNRFDSTGQASWAAAVPRLQAKARFDELDLNTLLAPDKPTAKAAAPADTPVSFDGLKAVDGQFGLSAGSLVFRQYRIGDAQLQATLERGLLRVQRLSGQAWGGSVVASGSAEAGRQRLAVKLAAQGVEVDALLKDVAGKDMLEGRGRVDADLTTEGASLGALRSNLAGTAALQVRDGAIKGINLARALRQAKAALSLKQDAVSQARSSEKTDFSELSASARIHEGVAHSDDLDVKSPFLRLGGAGRFDVGQGRIDYIARASVISTAAGQGGQELDALRGVTVPVRLSGPFDAIDWQIQWSGVAAAAVENKIKDKLAEKLGLKPAAPGAASAPASPKDQLKDKLLKGLFK